MASGWIIGGRAIRLLVALVFAAYNLVPLYGLHAWHWDAFQLLMLYWAETVVLASWALVRTEFVPTELLGNVTINGREQPATHASIVGILAAVAGGFCAIHLLFLCIIFSGDWFSRLHGVRDFAWTFVIASGAWAPLLMVIFGGGFDAVTGPYRPRFATAIMQDLGMAPPPVAPEAPGQAMGTILGGLFGRIVAMQIAIIFGAWVAIVWGGGQWGPVVPLTILVGLKTLFDFVARAG